MERNILTADCNSPGGLHRSPKPVVCIAGDLPHLFGDVVDGGDHVPGYLPSEGVTVHVERDRGQRCAHGYAQDGHRAAFCDPIDRVDGRSLNIKKSAPKQ